MPAYTFQSRFAPLVASGEKRQTIRAIGKRRHAAVGDRIQLYTGMRTKACRKLVTPDPVCTFAAAVYICHGIKNTPPAPAPSLHHTKKSYTHPPSPLPSSRFISLPPG